MDLYYKLQGCFYSKLISGWSVYAGLNGELHLVRKKTDRIYRYALFQRDPTDENPQWICKNLSWNNTFYAIVPWLRDHDKLQLSIQPITYYEARFTRLGKKLLGKPITFAREFPETPFYHYKPKDDIR